jgi:hypothetical protein
MTGLDWIDLAQDKNRWRALVNAVNETSDSWNAGKFLSSWGPVTISRTILFQAVN